jgi:hypothetical protein
VKTIEINRKFYKVPEQWNELSGRQLLQVIDLFFKGYPEEKALLKLLKILSGMSWWEFFRAPVTTVERLVFTRFRFTMSLGVFLFMSRRTCNGMDEYLYLSEFLLKENTLTKNLIPRYKEFYGPADAISNLRMGEFVFSEHFYMAWSEDKENAVLLNNLVATLYRPKKKNYDFRKNRDGDPRIAFNENLCEFYATSEIYAWPKNIKLAIGHFYEACRTKLVEDNPDVFGGGGEEAKHGLISIMISVAESHAFGDFEKVEQLHVGMIMIQLSEMIHKAKQLEKQMKS